MKPKILFLHGFYASGQCVPAVLTPDLPIHPKEAVSYIRDLIGQVKPNMLVGNSCGSFYAQMIAPTLGLPALLGNPHFKMTEFLETRVGAHQYKSPRKNGKQDFFIDSQLIVEFAEMEAHQFDNYHPDCKERIWGIFGEQDTLAHFEPLFLQYYSHSYHFPGGHTPTAEEVHHYYAPLIEKMLTANV